MSIDLRLQESTDFSGPEFQNHISVTKLSQRPKKQSQVDLGNEPASQYRLPIVTCVVAEIKCLTRTILDGGLF